MCLEQSKDKLGLSQRISNKQVRQVCRIFMEAAMFMFHVMKIARVNLDGKKPSHARALESAACVPAGELSFVLFRGAWLILMAFPCVA